MNAFVLLLLLVYGAATVLVVGVALLFTYVPRLRPVIIVLVALWVVAGICITVNELYSPLWIGPGL